MLLDQDLLDRVRAARSRLTSPDNLTDENIARLLTASGLPAGAGARVERRRQELKREHRSTNRPIQLELWGKR